MKLKGFAVIAALVLSATAQADTLFTYTFNPGSLFDFGAGNTYAATGSFVYNATTNVVTDVTYEAVQVGTGPTGPFIFTSATVVSPTDIIFKDDGFGDENEYFFASSLAGGGTIALTGGTYKGQSIVTVQGSVTSAVPEPASMALMLGGLGVLGAASRRRRTAPTA